MRIFCNFFMVRPLLLTWAVQPCGELSFQREKKVTFSPVLVAEGLFHALSGNLDLHHHSVFRVSWMGFLLCS